MSGLRGVGLAWRPETARLLERGEGGAFTEVLAESVDPDALPPALEALVASGVAVIVHGVGLGLGDAAGPDPAALRHLRRVADALRAPLVSEHLAFVRGDGREVGHLMSLPRTPAMAAQVAEAAARVADALGRPLALENPAGLFAWPEDTLDEPDFLVEVAARSGCPLLLDVSNLWAHACNHGGDASSWLHRLPLERVAYVHVAGGVERKGLYHDTHAHPLQPGPLGVLRALAAQLGGVPPVLLERDGGWSGLPALREELEAVRGAVAGAASLPSARQCVACLEPTAPPPQLAALQAQLTRALLDGAPAPPGFDPARVAASAVALGHKLSHRKPPRPSWRSLLRRVLR